MIRITTESFKFASLLLDQGLQIIIPSRIVSGKYTRTDWKRHLTIFCIDPIVVYLDLDFHEPSVSKC